MPFPTNPQTREEKRAKNREYMRKYRASGSGKAYVQKYRADEKNRERRRARERETYSPEQHRKWMLKKNYGLTPEQYDEMLVAQNYVCLICGNDNSANRHSRLNVDHCHTTGKVRGLLCTHCNHAIGKFKDDPGLLEKAAAYLRRHL